MKKSQGLDTSEESGCTRGDGISILGNDKPRQCAMANTLKLSRDGAVGFIDWLDL
jgi:hypothetical protein